MGELLSKILGTCNQDLVELMPQYKDNIIRDRQTAFASF